MALAVSCGDDGRMVETGRQMRKIAEGREAEVFAWDDGRVLKLYRNDGYAPNAQYEAAGLRAARSAGGIVPEPGDEVRVQDRPGLLMERVEGEDLLALLGKKPWLMFRAGTVLGETHARLHEAVAPPELRSLHERLIRSIERGASEAPEYAHLAAFALDVLQSLPEGDRLLHGDFHPGQVLMTARGPVVIDWPNATRGDPHADVARTLLMLDIASVPPGTPLAVRRLQGIGRGIVRARYIAAYRKARPLDEELLARWRIPVAAQRLTDGIEDERETLLRMLEREGG